MPNTTPPRNAGKAAIIIVAIGAVVWAIIFFGMNISHRQSVVSEQKGQLPPDSTKSDAKPQGPHDLGTEPSSHK